MMTELNLFKEFDICSIDELRTKGGATILKVRGTRRDSQEEKIFVPPHLEKWCLVVALINIL